MDPIEVMEIFSKSVWANEPMCSWSDFEIPANLIAYTDSEDGPMILVTDKGVVILDGKGDTLYDSSGGELTRYRKS